MKIAVVGAGAMGSVYAGLFADAGNEVWAIDVWREHIDAIAENGLRVEGASGDRLVRTVKASCDAADAGPCDLVIIATKASGVEAAATSLGPLLRDDTIVLAMQNGLGAGDRVRRFLPDANILLGVAQAFGASMKGPGHAHHNGMSLIRIGEMDGGLTPRANAIAQTWQEAGFEAKAFDDINQLIWEKFVCNAAFSAPCTVFNRTVGEMMADPHAWQVSLGCGLEAYRTGRAKGVNFSYDDAEAYIRDFAGKLMGARPSMLLDHMASRPSEIDAINGMVPVVAAEVGLTAPYNEVVTAIVRAREAEFDKAS